jgi:hypothetical protein
MASRVRSHRLRRPPLRSARAMDHRVAWMAAVAIGSGGKGIGLERTMANVVSSVGCPESRSSITRAPKRLAPTPSPVYPAA